MQVLFAELVSLLGRLHFGCGQLAGLARHDYLLGDLVWLLRVAADTLGVHYKQIGDGIIITGEDLVGHIADLPHLNLLVLVVGGFYTEGDHYFCKLLVSLAEIYKHLDLLFQLVQDIRQLK